MNAIAATTRNYQLPLIKEVKEHAGANNSDAYRSLVRLAINRKIDPVTDIAFDALSRVSIFFPPALAAMVNAIAEKHELTFQSAAAGLAKAGADYIEAEKSDGVAIEDKDVPFAKPRPAQAIFYKSIMQGLSTAKIVVAEASTGVGKGRALMAAAITSVYAGKTPVIVAAPTVNIVSQLWSELKTLRSEGYGQDVSATISLGSTEFADDIKLKEWLNDPENAEVDPPVADWIRKGAPHHSNKDRDDAIGQFATEQGITLAWLMSDLHKIANNMSVEDFVLRTDRNDPHKESESRILLAEIREAANRKKIEKNKKSKETTITHAGADIILCTHAMLSLGQKTNWAVLPQPAVLVIDEAHLLEETISRMNSHQISLFAINYRLARFCRENGTKKGSVPRDALALAKSFMGACQKLSDSDGRVKLNDDAEKYNAVSSGLSALSKIVGSKAFAVESRIQKDMRDLLKNAALIMENGKTQSSAYLNFSPDRRYPLISVGAESIGREAGALWKAAEGGAVLASATMYITDEYGEQKCDYVVRNLAIPLARLSTPIPVVAEYIYTIPTLHIPSPELCGELSRPDGKDREAIGNEDQWLQNMAQQVLKIVSTATGGTLVLFNSYAQVKGIAQHLQTMQPDLIPRLIEQKRGKKFASFVDAYTELHSKTGNPILIGLGPAWTGLDLSDKAVSALKDTLLTNLVIGCSPIGLNQTPTMQKRIALTKTSAISKEALLILKQGLGRLIRRNGVKDRHIWVLDGRIWSTTWLRQFTGPAKRLLGKYKTVRQIT